MAGKENLAPRTEGQHLCTVPEQSIVSEPCVCLCALPPTLQATQAHMAGNKAMARELRSRAQWHNEQMKAAQAMASEAFFQKRCGAAQPR